MISSQSAALTVRVTRSSNAGKRPEEPSATSARTPSVPRKFSARLLQPRCLLRSSHDHRHESQCQWGARYGAIAADLSQHRAA